MKIPPLAPIRQTTPQPVVADVAAETRRHWLDSRFAGRLRRGVASRSASAAEASPMSRRSCAPHSTACATSAPIRSSSPRWAATAAPPPTGQRELLAEYGISEQALGVPVKTDMTAVPIGTNSWGEPVCWDKNALEADAVVTVSRIKPHTDFRGRFESGIAKMLVIGLGKRDGASQHHRWGVRGLRDMLPETAKVVLEKTPFQAGLAVLENAHEQTAPTAGGRPRGTLRGRARSAGRGEAVDGPAAVRATRSAGHRRDRQELQRRRHRSQRRRPAAHRVRTGDREADALRASAVSICRRRATATAPAAASPTSPPNACSSPSTRCRSA